MNTRTVDASAKTDRRLMLCARAGYELTRLYAGTREGAAPLGWEFAHLIDRDLAYALASHVLSGQCDIAHTRFEFFKARGWAFGTRCDYAKKQSPMMMNALPGAALSNHDMLFVEAVRAMARALEWLR